MKVLVGYATRHGATRGIAERIAERLDDSGFEVTLKPVEDVDSVDEYDALVIGSAAYYFHWLKEATAFVRRHRSVLAKRDVWLFSSGPLNMETPDGPAADPLKASEPKEFAQLARDIEPHDMRVFFGAYDPDAEPEGLVERLTRLMPAVRDALPAGDFRDWREIEAWADGIARKLRPSTLAPI